jgi:hypothetical protein
MTERLPDLGDVVWYRTSSGEYAAALVLAAGIDPNDPWKLTLLVFHPSGQTEHVPSARVGDANGEWRSRS